jgi:glyoxylase-like metal-dependent hydrolase (beta-lactamase superfamily II)
MLTVKSFSFNPLQENTYVLSDEKDACYVIDPGCYFGNERAVLKEYIEEQGLSPRMLLNTHCHLDHVFGNKFVSETWDLPLHLHEKEEPVLASAPEYGEAWELPFENYQGELVFLSPDQPLLLGENKLDILFLPGHSPGSIGFYCAAQDFLIGGDVLFLEGIGRTDLAGGDHHTLFKSIFEQILPLPDKTIVYPGHGESTTIGHERVHNPFLR